MRHNIHLITLAALVALALAAVSGVLLPSDSAVHAQQVDTNRPPVFDSGLDTNLEVDENTPPGVNIGNPITATDPDDDGEGDDDLEFGDTLTYSLEGADADSFDIDASTGQLITKVALDHETKDSYSVTVKVEDGESRGTKVTRDVTITVEDVAEPPSAPAAPTVVSSPTDPTTSLKMVWHAPENTGDAITGYEVAYKKSNAAMEFAVIDGVGVDNESQIATIDGLEAGTSYLVRVHARNGEGSGPWSLVGIESTIKESNTPPRFTESADADTGSITRSVPENTGPGQNVGGAVEAVDDEALRPLTYRLGGPDADSFDFNTSSRQIRTKRGVTYDYETKPTHYVTVTAFDGAGGSDALKVAIAVKDKLEPPAAPARPMVKATVRGAEKNSRSLDVSWKEPENTGPPITGYNVQYRKAGSGNYIDRGVTVNGDTATIAPTDDNGTSDVDERLTPGSSYEVRVRALNGELDTHGNWSPPATGRTSPGNQGAKFVVRSDTEARKAARSRPERRSVDENTPQGKAVGSAVRARDRDKLTYKLVAADSPNEAHVGKFDINESTGQILTKDPLNTEATCSSEDATESGGHQENCTYTVRVEVGDGLGEHGNKEEGDPTNDAAAEERVDDRITVKITVRDRPEPPARPEVTVTSLTDGTTLDVVWVAPENTGPPITGYDVECTGDGVAAGTCPVSDVADAIAASVNIQITGLSVGKPYRVRVRMANAEGNGTWSAWVSQSTNKADNDVPVFSSPPAELTVDENAPARTDLPSPVSVSPDSSSGSIRYTVEGPDASLFDIDANGQILIKRSLNHEDAACGYVATDDPTTCTYNVRVKAADSDFGSAYHPVKISVVNVEEPPDRPTAPKVTARKDSGRSLDVTWKEPRNTGPAITDYVIQYRKVPRRGETASAFTSCNAESCSHTDTEKKATIGDLEPRTQYEVQVRATNGESDDTLHWSPSGRGTTGASNNRPTFEYRDSLITLGVDEGTRAGQNVGSAVSATDSADRHRLTYSLEGPGAESFTINRSTGQIRTKAPLDYETRKSYSVTVTVNDGQKKDNSIATKSVTIEIDDVEELPSAPSPPKVSGVRGSTDSVRVTWDEPANTGPPIIDYDLQYRSSGGGWSDQNSIHEGADRSAIITGLTPGTRYEVQVRARNNDGPGNYSRSGTGSPNPDVANQKPVFSPSGARTFEIEENSVAAGDPIGTAVMAVDADNDVVTHTLEGTDAASFTVDPGSGQIRATAALNHEEKSRYSVTVKATDTRGGSTTVRVTIVVTDVEEPPDTPFPPTVTAASTTSLSISWDAPENTGPPITDYDYRYRDASGSWTEVTNTTITGTTATIEGLTSSTSYDVEVRAKNAEGTSDWSNPGIGSTAAPGANSPPVFSDGSSTTRSVSAAAPADTLIGDPVAATDADSGDTLTYSLQGMNAASFDIRSDTGQLITSSGVTLTVGTTYTVTVVASDGKDRTEITVTIEVTAAPPNKAPVFSGGPRSFTVRENAAAGTSIGSPVRATDADGDTLTYSLEGTDASSFDIRTNTGQIVTRSGVSLRAGATQTVTVVADDGKTGRATVAVTIRVIQGTFGCDTRGAVSDRSNTGLVSDCESLLVARNAIEGSTRLNWSVVTPIEQWEGVYLNGTNGMPTRVTAIVLRRRGLDGTIPAELGQLPMLTQLNLHSNDLTGSIPADLARLSRLERLLLHNNRLTGTIPNLSGLRNLKMLWLSGKEMGLTGPVPSWLNSMSGLESLSLWGNELSGPIPRLTGMTSLSLLKLQSNNLTGGVPSWLGEMSSLRGLYIHENPLGGTIPPELGRLTRLRRIWLHSSQLNGEIPRELANMTNLATLNLRGNQLTGPIPPALGLMGELQQLLLHDNELTGSIPSQLGSLSKLQKLWLSQNRLTGLIPESLGGLSSLTQLNLHTNQLSGEFPSALGALGDTLTSLRLTGNTGLTGCVPAALAGAIDAEDLRGAGSAGLSICN